MVGLGGHLWGPSGPTVHLDQGHLQGVAQEGVQSGFEHLQGWSLHTHSGQPVPVFDNPLRKMLFLILRCNST